MDENTITPPGTDHLLFYKNRGTEWYCDRCVAFIRPIYLRVGKTIYPACMECFYDESGSKFDVARKEETNVALPVDTSGVTWEIPPDVPDIPAY